MDEKQNGLRIESPESTARDEAAETEDLRRRIQALQPELARADKHLRAALRERPFVALGTAVALGFVLGRVIGRS